MALELALFALPRSGTTWAANWLTSDGIVCRHEPITYEPPEQILRASGGVACTGLWLHSAFLARLDCPVVLLERDPAQINASLARINLPALPHWLVARFAALDYPRFHYTDLFDPQRAAAIWRILRGEDFDAARHAELVRMNVQPQYNRCVPDASILMDFWQQEVAPSPIL